MSQAGTKTIRVLLVDDYDMLLESLAIALEEFPDLELVGSASSGWDAIAKSEALKPDVVLMDVLMPELDGLSTARIIRQRDPNIKFVMLSSFAQGHLLQAAREIGVSAYLVKNVSIDELSAAIRNAYLGNPGSFPD